VATIIDDTPVEMNIGNICNGAVPEQFSHLVEKVLANIGDLNTDPEVKRAITLKFTFIPAQDRKSAIVVLETATKLASVDKVKGSLFFRQRQGKIEAFTEDPRQQALFAKEATATPSKQ
jgi:hypothetical protein